AVCSHFHDGSSTAETTDEIIRALAEFGPAARLRGSNKASEGPRESQGGTIATLQTRLLIKWGWGVAQMGKLPLRQVPALPKNMKPPPSEFRVMRVRECAAPSMRIETPEEAVAYWHANVQTADWFDPSKEAFVVMV